MTRKHTPKGDIPCMCDGCGKESACDLEEKGPPGWFWTDICSTDGDIITTVLACSTACTALKWKRALPRQRPDHGE